MALHPDSYLPKFFTEERLKAYRDLHQRFPLWCGEWPAAHTNIPEALAWNGRFRVAYEATVVGSDLFVDFEPWHDSPTVLSPRRARILLAYQDGQEGAGDDEAPHTLHALFSAIDYNYARWRSGIGPSGSGKPYAGSEPDPLDHWAALLERILTNADLAVGIGDEGESGLSGFKLLKLRERVLLPRDPSRDRKADNQAVKDYWEKIGQEVGVIPDLSGGRKVSLRGTLLGDLLEEGTRLVKEVAEHEPQPSELDDVRNVFFDGREVLKPIDQEKYDWFVRGGNPDRAEELKMQRLRSALDDATASSWAQRLAYPMLSQTEIESTVAKARGRAPKVVESQARRLIEARLALVGLDVASDTLWKDQGKHPS